MFFACLVPPVLNVLTRYRQMPLTLTVLACGGEAACPALSVTGAFPHRPRITGRGSGNPQLHQPLLLLPTELVPAFVLAG